MKTREEALEWIKQFVDKVVEMELDEIRLLEHNFIFEEFACMYDEVWYFKGHEAFIDKMTRDKGLDFIIGSIHFVDKFAFDHTAELWEGRDVDKIYRRYFEDSVDLVRRV